MLFYRVPHPDQAMLVSGGKHKTDDGGTTPFKVIVGHGAFITPIVRTVSFIDLSMQESVVKEECITTQGIACNVQAVIAFKVGNTVESIVNAATRFLGDQGNGRMTELVGQIFAGHLRSIVGSMSVEQIIRERQTLAASVLDASKVEMGNLGLVVDSFQISKIDDMGSGYIEALARPQRAAALQAAKIAEAQAAQAAAEAEQESQARQAEYVKNTQLAQAQYARDTAMATAQFEAETSAKQQEAGQAGPLAAAQAQQAVLREQAAAAREQAALVEAQYVVNTVKPAEAMAQKTEIDARAAASARLAEATAEAEATRLAAQAAASSDRVALDQKLIELLPDIVSASATALSGSNLTILNGAQGISELLTQALTQGLTAFSTVKSSLRPAVETARKATASDDPPAPAA
jgi:flotillin